MRTQLVDGLLADLLQVVGFYVCRLKQQFTNNLLHLSVLTRGSTQSCPLGLNVLLLFPGNKSSNALSSDNDIFLLSFLSLLLRISLMYNRFDIQPFLCAINLSHSNISCHMQNPTVQCKDEYRHN